MKGEGLVGPDDAKQFELVCADPSSIKGEKGLGQQSGQHQEAQEVPAERWFNRPLLWGQYWADGCFPSDWTQQAFFDSER